MYLFQLNKTYLIQQANDKCIFKYYDHDNLSSIRLLSSQDTNHRSR